MTQSEAFEANLTTGGDACVIRSKLLFQSTTPTGGVPVILLSTLNPSNLGSRQAAAANLFSSYRIKEIVVKFLPNANGTPAGNVAVAVGFLDDATSGEPDAPTTASSVAELRCSGTSLGSQTVPTIFRWSPVDKTLWYKTQNAGEARFVSPGSMFGGTTGGAANISIELDFTIVYKGATDLGVN
jgi:hypothetical protein